MKKAIKAIGVTSVILLCVVSSFQGFNNNGAQNNSAALPLSKELSTELTFKGFTQDVLMDGNDSAGINNNIEYIVADANGNDHLMSNGGYSPFSWVNSSMIDNEKNYYEADIDGNGRLGDQKIIKVGNEGQFTIPWENMDITSEINSTYGVNDLNYVETKEENGNVFYFKTNSNDTSNNNILTTNGSSTLRIDDDNVVRIDNETLGVPDKELTDVWFSPRTLTKTNSADQFKFLTNGLFVFDNNGKKELYYQGVYIDDFGMPFVKVKQTEPKLVDNITNIEDVKFINTISGKGSSFWTGISPSTFVQIDTAENSYMYYVGDTYFSLATSMNESGGTLTGNQTLDRTKLVQLTPWNGKYQINGDNSVQTTWSSGGEINPFKDIGLTSNAALPKFVKTAADSNSFLGLDADGQLYSWGAYTKMPALPEIEFPPVANDDVLQNENGVSEPMKFKNKGQNRIAKLNLEKTANGSLINDGKIIDIQATGDGWLFFTNQDQILQFSSDSQHWNKGKITNVTPKGYKYETGIKNVSFVPSLDPANMDNDELVWHRTYDNSIVKTNVLTKEDSIEENLAPVAYFVSETGEETGLDPKIDKDGLHLTLATNELGGTANSLDGKEITLKLSKSLNYETNPSDIFDIKVTLGTRELDGTYKIVVPLDQLTSHANVIDNPIYLIGYDDALNGNSSATGTTEQTHFLLDKDIVIPAFSGQLNTIKANVVEGTQTESTFDIDFAVAGEMADPVDPANTNIKYEFGGSQYTADYDFIEKPDSENEWIYTVKGLEANKTYNNISLSGPTFKEIVIGSAKTTKKAPLYNQSTLSNVKTDSFDIEIVAASEGDYQPLPSPPMIGYGSLDANNKPSNMFNEEDIDIKGDQESGSGSPFRKWFYTIKGLTPNTTYTNISVSLDYGKTWTALPETGNTVITLPKKAEIINNSNSFETSQTKIDGKFYVNASGWKIDGNKQEWWDSQYDIINISSDPSANDVIIQYNVNDYGWVQIDPTTIVPKQGQGEHEKTLELQYEVAELETGDSVVVQAKIGDSGFVSLGSTKTDQVKPIEFEVGNVTPDYHSASFDLSLDKQDDLIYRDFDPELIRAKEAKGNNISINYEFSDSDETDGIYTYKFSQDLNPDYINDGKEWKDLSIYYKGNATEDNYDKKISFNTKPLEKISKGSAEANFLYESDDSISFSLSDLLTNADDGKDNKYYQKVSLKGENTNVKFRMQKAGESNAVDITSNKVSLVSDSADSTIFNISDLESGTAYTFEVATNEDDFANWTLLGTENTESLSTPNISTTTIDQESISQNSFSASSTMISGGDYQTFDPNTDKFETRLITVNDQIVKGDTSNLIKRDSGIEGEETNVYDYTVSSLPAQTEFRKLEYKINDSSWINANMDLSTFSTLDRNETTIKSGTYKFIQKDWDQHGYDEMSFYLEIRDRNNYSSFTSNDVTVKLTTESKNKENSGNVYNVASKDITVNNEGQVAADEDATKYQFDLKNLPSGINVNKIEINLGDGNWQVISSQEIGSNGGAGTVPLEKNTISSIVFDAPNRNSVTFDATILVGEGYEKFDAKNMKVWADKGEVSKESGSVRDERVKLDVKFLTIKDSQNYQYQLYNLESNKVYSNFHFTIDGSLDSSTTGLRPDTQITTKIGENPIESDTFKPIFDTITNESFNFTLSAKNEDDTYGLFDPSKLRLFAKVGSGIPANTKELEIRFVKQFSYVDSNKTEYSYSVQNLDAGTQYSGFRLEYVGIDSWRNNVPSDVSVTTKEFKSPFDPVKNPISFDEDSIKADSFEFTIAISSDVTRASYSQFAKNETVLSSDGTEFTTTLINEDSSQKAEGLTLYTYIVTGLNPNTYYGDISVTINSLDGETESGKQGDVYYKYAYNVPYFSITTRIDMHKVYIIGGSSLAIIILLIILLIIWFFFKKIKRMTQLYIVGLPVNSLKSNILVWRVHNARRHPNIWAHKDLDNFKLYIDDREIEAIFRKDHTDGSLLISSKDSEFSLKEILKLIGSFKYNRFKMSFNGGVTIKHIENINLRYSKRIEIINNKNREREMNKSLSMFKNSKDATVWAKTTIQLGQHVKDTTSTTVRALLIQPTDHVLLSPAVDLVEFFDKLKFYYNLDGRLYEIKTKYVEKEGNIIKFDMLGLEPGTVYPDLHVIMLGKSAPLNSSVIYVITKDEKGREVSLKNAVLPTVKKTIKSIGLNDPEVIKNYVPEELLERTREVVVKKHYQRDTGMYISDSKVKSIQDEYINKWYDPKNIDKYEPELYELVRKIIVGHKDVFSILKEKDEKTIKYEMELSQLDNVYLSIKTGMSIGVQKIESNSTKIRLAFTFPKDNKIVNPKFNIKKLIDEKFKYYYQLDDKLYEFKTKFIKRTAQTIYIDLLDLTPHTAYFGLHWSLDSGRSIINSVSPYLVTKKENGDAVSFRDADIVAMPEKAKTIPLPSQVTAVDYLGDELYRDWLTLTVRKHYWRDNNQKWLKDSKLEKEIRRYQKKWYKTKSVDKNIEELIKSKNLITDKADQINKK